MMAESRIVRVAALQPALEWLRPMPNMHRLRQAAEGTVRAHGTDLLVLPEAFAGLPCDHDEGVAARQARQFLSTLAKACRVNVIGGSIDYPHDDGSRRNTCFVVDRDGREVGRYDKRVLFAREMDARQAGAGAGVFELDAERARIRVGVLICADLWDPALARELMGRADLLCVPAKTTVPSDRHVEYARSLWWNLALTRAMENGLPVVVSDWAEGRHESKRLVEGTMIRDVHFTCGGGSLCDPSGRPEMARIQQTIARGAPGVLTAAIDLDAVARFREYRQSVGLLPK
ncbi:MAG: carbon-nitrogen hydrolase family protein [Phycisphaerae bacterium]